MLHDFFHNWPEEQALGLLVVIAGFISLQAFEKKKKTSSLATLLETVIAAALTLVMGQRFLQAQRLCRLLWLLGSGSSLIIFVCFKRFRLSMALSQLNNIFCIVVLS